MINEKPLKTLKDIADQANVSQSLVSLILNGKGRASDRVRKKVITLLEDAGYRPKYARHPFYFIVDLPEIEAAGKTQNVFEELSGMQRVFNTYDLELRIEFLSTTDGSNTIDLIEQLKAIIERKPSGVLIGTDFSFLKDACVLFHSNKIPLVQIGYDTENPKYNAVVSDSFTSAYMATKYLIDNGHQRIAILRWLAGQAGINSNKKFAGYRTALSDAAIQFQNDYVINTNALQEDPEWRPAREFVAGLLQLPDPPTALVVENSFIGISLLYPIPSDSGRLPDTLKNFEIVQCEDWALQPVHDIVSKKLFYPEMETILVCIDWETIGKTAAQMIIEKSARASIAPEIARISPSLYRVNGNVRELVK